MGMKFFLERPAKSDYHASETSMQFRLLGHPSLDDRTVMKSSRSFFLLLSTSIIFSACISFRSGMDGTFAGDAVRGMDRAPVSVFFHFTHLEQEKGLDVVPKIVPPQRGFRDIFGASMTTLSNIRTFATFTDNDNDIDAVERRAKRDSLKGANDVTIHITMLREDSFAKHFLASILSYGTLAVVPTGYSWDYTMTAEVRSSSGALIRSYTRHSTLSTWYQAMFFIIYPFYPSEVKIEEIYLESMQNIFQQIEHDGVLKRP